MVVMEKKGDIRITSATIHSGDTCRLVYEIEKQDKKFALYYEVDRPYGGYFCDVADGVVVTFLSYAMRGGYDIVSEVPVSEKLYYQITEHLVPHFLAATPDAYETRIICDTVNPRYAPSEVAMAMSCGLDSLASYYKSIEDGKRSAYKVSLLTFFQNGAHHMGTIGHDEREPVVFEEQLSHVKQFCEKINVPLLAVRSNLDAVLSELFWNDSYQNTHSFRNAGFVLLFQKLIKTYFYGAAYTAVDFDASLKKGDSAKFDIFLFPNVSTANTDIYVTESAMTRIEKILYLDRYPEVYDALLVCYKGAKNCGTCVKCSRTLVELDFAGVLDKYEKCFDLPSYKKRRKEFVIRTFIKKDRGATYRDIYTYSKKEKLGIPASWYAISYVGSIVRNAVEFSNRCLKRLARLKKDK